MIRKSGLAPEGSDIITYHYVDVGRHAGSGWLSLECLLKEVRFLVSNNLDNDAQLLLASKRQNLVRSPPGPHRFLPMQTLNVAAEILCFRCLMLNFNFLGDVADSVPSSNP